MNGFAGVTTASAAGVIDYDRLRDAVAQWRADYAEAVPFPSIVIDNFLDPAALAAAIGQFPETNSEYWRHYVHVNERKLAITKRDLIPDWPGRIIDELNSPQFLEILCRITGIEGLVPDESLEGGGLHKIDTGGFLNIHADFTAHPFRANWARRVNLLLYLNENWDDSYGGFLELWDKQAASCVRKIAPIANRCVIFSTDPDSFHGHPDPLTCPEHRSRRSIALYYFTDHDRPVFARSTEYRARPDDKAVKKVLIFLDKMALRGFDFAKRRLGLSSDLASSLLGALPGARRRRKPTDQR